jgi:branched-subunit amino acid aminotransferase/4-amino-4-deoxychorismate lyase
MSDADATAHGAQPRRLVWLNGRFMPADEAQLSAFDAGVQHGIGLFETMLAVWDAADQRPRVLDLDRHLRRLADSARELRLTEALRTDRLADAVDMAVERTALVDPERRARVRLTLTGGDLNLLHRPMPSAEPNDADGPAPTQPSQPSQPGDPTILIAVTPAQQYPAAMFDRGVRLTIADPRANPLNPFEGHKTLNYWWRLRALQDAAAKGAGEALVLQVTNHVAGAAVSNLFAVKDGTLRTPIARGEEERIAQGKAAMPSPVLPGVTRGRIIELAAARGIGCDTRMLSIDDVLDADEVFLTNSSWGVLPAVAVEAKAIADGNPGPITADLRRAWLAEPASEG